MLPYIDYSIIKRTGFAFVLTIVNILLCYSQNTPLDRINQAYKELHHTLDAFIIDTVDGIEIYTWKKFKEKANGIVTFACYEEMDVGTREGFEGQIRFKDGIKHGLAKIINCKTGTFYDINYKMGILDGYCKIYLDTYTISYGEREYIKVTFYETTFTKGNGVWKDFYSNGDLKETGKYKSGKKNGEWLYYSENNNLYLKRYFDEGNLIDSVKFDIPQTEILEIRLNY